MNKTDKKNIEKHKEFLENMYKHYQDNKMPYWEDNPEKQIIRDALESLKQNNLIDDYNLNN